MGGARLETLRNKTACIEAEIVTLMLINKRTHIPCFIPSK